MIVMRENTALIGRKERFRDTAGNKPEAFVNGRTGFTWRGTAGIHNGGSRYSQLNGCRGLLACCLHAMQLNDDDDLKLQQLQATTPPPHQGQGAVRSGGWSQSQLPACVCTALVFTCIASASASAPDLNEPCMHGMHSCCKHRRPPLHASSM